MLLRKIIKCDQHNAASSLYFFFMPIIANLKKFHFRNIGRRLLNLFLLEHRRLEDVFLGAPSEDRQHQTECMWRILSRSSCGSFFPPTFLKKRISTLITAGKQLKVLKVRQISVYALTVRLSLWVSDLVHEVSVRATAASKRQGRMKRNVSTLNMIVLIHALILGWH